jgi:uncharacterized protein with ParB-like and HNH nuclease domain
MCLSRLLVVMWSPGKGLSSSLFAFRNLGMGADQSGKKKQEMFVILEDRVFSSFDVNMSKE